MDIPAKKEQEIFENKYIYAWKEQGIFCAKYKTDVLIGLEAAKEIVNFRKNLFQGASYSTVVYYPKLFGCVTSDARNYFATDEATEGIRMGAFVVDNYLVKIIGNAFLKIDRPNVPARIFNNNRDAFQWILSEDIPNYIKAK